MTDVEMKAIFDSIHAKFKAHQNEVLADNPQNVNFTVGERKLLRSVLPAQISAQAVKLIEQERTITQLQRRIAALDDKTEELVREAAMTRRWPRNDFSAEVEASAGEHADLLVRWMAWHNPVPAQMLGMRERGRQACPSGKSM